MSEESTDKVGPATVFGLPSGRANSLECASLLALAFAQSRIRRRGSLSDDRPWNVVPHSMDVVRISEDPNRPIHKRE